MRCPYCGSGENKVIDSRPSRDEASVRRRRECLECQKRFTTYEYVETLPLHVVKRNGNREPYDREKMVEGVRLAVTKRPVPMEKIDELVGDIERQLHATATKEVSSEEIGELVMRGLKQLDEVAYIRYASVYRRFQDAGAFTKEVRKLS